MLHLLCRVWRLLELPDCKETHLSSITYNGCNKMVSCHRGNVLSFWFLTCADGCFMGSEDMNHGTVKGCTSLDLAGLTLLLSCLSCQSLYTNAMWRRCVHWWWWSVQVLLGHWRVACAKMMSSCYYWRVFTLFIPPKLTQSGIVVFDTHALKFGTAVG